MTILKKKHQLGSCIFATSSLCSEREVIRSVKGHTQQLGPRPLKCYTQRIAFPVSRKCDMDSDSQAARRGRLLGRGRRPGVGHSELPVPLDAGELADVGDAGEDVSEDGDGHGARVLREDETAHHVDQHLLRVISRYMIHLYVSVVGITMNWLVRMTPVFADLLTLLTQISRLCTAENHDNCG